MISSFEFPIYLNIVEGFHGETIRSNVGGLPAHFVFEEASGLATSSSEPPDAPSRRAGVSRVDHMPTESGVVREYLVPEPVTLSASTYYSYPERVDPLRAKLLYFFISRPLPMPPTLPPAPTCASRPLSRRL